MDRAIDHRPMLFAHSRMVRRPVGQSVVLIEKGPRGQHNFADVHWTGWPASSGFSQHLSVYTPSVGVCPRLVLPHGGVSEG